MRLLLIVLVHASYQVHWSHPAGNCATDACHRLQPLPQLMMGHSWRTPITGALLSPGGESTSGTVLLLLQGGQRARPRRQQVPAAFPARCRRWQLGTEASATNRCFHAEGKTGLRQQ